MTSLSPTEWPPFQVKALNIDRPTENKVHVPGKAEEMGLRGSVVTGAITYGQMTHPLVSRYGLDWLGEGWSEVRFMKPAYEGDAVTITTAPDPGAGRERAYRVQAHNAEGVQLVQVHTHLPRPLPPLDDLARVPPVNWEGERQPISWELLELNKPFRAYIWETSMAEHLQWCDTLQDDLPIYREGPRPPLHPGAILDRGSKVISNQFYLEFWIHATSQMTTRGVMRVGDVVEVRCIPLEKWEKRGNEWARFYQVFLVDGEPMMEVMKTSVFKVNRVG